MARPAAAATARLRPVRSTSMTNAATANTMAAACRMPKSCPIRRSGSSRSAAMDANSSNPGHGLGTASSTALSRSIHPATPTSHGTARRPDTIARAELNDAVIPLRSLMLACASSRPDAVDPPVQGAVFTMEGPMNHTDVVARVKADLEARGVNLTGADGAFEITKRVAWELRAEGAGLLDKPGGNNSHGFATDIICYPTGQIYDILVSGGDVNGPSWQDAGMVDASRYRPAVAVDPGPPPVPPGPPGALDELVAKLDAMTALLASLDRKLDAMAEQSNTNTEKIQQQVDQAVKNVEKTAAAALPLLGGLLGKH